MTSIEMTNFPPSKNFCANCQGELIYIPDRSALCCRNCQAATIVNVSQKKIPTYRWDESQQSSDEPWTQPAALLPFRITEHEAAARIKEALQQIETATTALPTLPQAYYIPFYLFRIKAKAVYHTSVTGLISLAREPYLIKACDKLPHRYAGQLKWNLGKLLPYDEAFLSGFSIVEASVALKDAYQTAMDLAAYDLECAVCNEIKDSERRSLRYEAEYPETTFRLILLPVYVGYFGLEGRRRYYAVDGNEGSISGDLPVRLSVRKPPDTPIKNESSALLSGKIPKVLGEVIGIVIMGMGFIGREILGGLIAQFSGVFFLLLVVGIMAGLIYLFKIIF